MDRDKLAKLLALTQSSNDHEALVAMRKANEHISIYAKTWGMVLCVVAPPSTAPKLADPMSQAMKEMLVFCEKNLAPGPFTRKVERLRFSFDHSQEITGDDFFQMVKLYRKLKALVEARGD